MNNYNHHKYIIEISFFKEACQRRTHHDIGLIAYSFASGSLV